MRENGAGFKEWVRREIMTRGLRGLFVNHACPLNEIRDRWATLDTPGSSWRVDVRGRVRFAYRLAR